jgi:hypothetical protein
MGADTEHYDKSIEVTPEDIPPSKPLIEAKPTELTKRKRGRPSNAEIARRHSEDEH